MSAFTAAYPFVVTWFAILDATILVLVGTYISLDFVRRGDDLRPETWSRFIPAAVFFVGFNVIAALVLAVAKALLST